MHRIYSLNIGSQKQDDEQHGAAYLRCDKVKNEANKSRYLLLGLWNTASFHILLFQII